MSPGYWIFGTNRKGLISDSGSLQVKRYISGSNVNMIMRNCMSLFSCKDVAVRFSILHFR